MLNEQEERTVHAINAHEFYEGKVFGWRDDTSPTGWLSGIVVRTASCSVTVTNIRPGVLSTPTREG